MQKRVHKTHTKSENIKILANTDTYFCDIKCHSNVTFLNVLNYLNTLKNLYISITVRLI